MYTKCFCEISVPIINNSKISMTQNYDKHLYSS